MPLHKLPFDIFFCVFSYMDAMDILLLGQTCTALRSVTQKRSVWIACLQRSSARNMIFPGTFPNYGDMDLERLKDAASGSSRVLAMLRGGSPANLPDRDPPLCKFKKQHIIRQPKVEGDQDNQEYPGFTKLCLIPGGRFCITYTRTEILFYDLHTGTQIGTSSQTPISVGHGDDWMFIASPSLNGKEIRLGLVQAVLVNGSQDQLVVQLSVVRFVVDGPNGIHEVKVQKDLLEISMPNCLEYYILVQDMFIYTYFPISHDGSEHWVLNVCNFIDHTFASWRIPSLAYVGIFYDDGHVVMITNAGKLKAWKIPPLEPRRGTDSRIPVQVISEAFSFPFEVGAFNTRPRISRCYRLESPWYNTYQPPEFFSVEDKEGGLNIWTTYQIQKPLSSIDNEEHLQQKHVVSHPLKCYFPVRRPAHHYFYSNSFRRCDDCCVKLFSKGGQPFVVVRSPFSDNITDEEPEPEFVVELEYPEDFPLSGTRSYKTVFDFDPFSGRLVYTSESWEEIVVLDYLAHPETLNDSTS
ncbi:hypothetical protein BJ165DRAFT_1452036 [Panaeolus papilionaceus]|nr:hypothetical protein BJ165DRAFT_1452036 [Panaeolus papilionaceus]